MENKSAQEEKVEELEMNLQKAKADYRQAFEEIERLKGLIKDEYFIFGF